MSEQLGERLKALEAEFETGKKMLAEVEAREAALRSMLLRISGAIQVLREFVPPAEAEPGALPAEISGSSVVAN